MSSVQSLYPLPFMRQNSRVLDYKHENTLGMNSTGFETERVKWKWKEWFIQNHSDIQDTFRKVDKVVEDTLSILFYHCMGNTQRNKGNSWPNVNKWKKIVLDSKNGWGTVNQLCFCMHTKRLISKISSVYPGVSKLRQKTLLSNSILAQQFPVLVAPLTHQEKN